MLMQPSLTGNTATGDGDVRLPNLLSGAFGVSGDVVYVLGGGYGTRAFRTSKTTTLPAGTTTGAPAPAGRGGVPGSRTRVDYRGGIEKR